MRKIIVYIATSVDGYIARADGGVEWLDRPRPKGNYGMTAFYKSIDTVVMGRKTYDVMRTFGEESYTGKKNYVFSRTHESQDNAKVAFVNRPVSEFAKQLRFRKGKNIWLVGGAELIAAFLDELEIDEFIIHVVPIFIGEGIPLIHPKPRAVPLRLLSSHKYSDGVLALHYAVPREGIKHAEE
jgi:dihydrofolate reductase